MQLLAIDTATEACSVALLYDGQVLERFTTQSKTHSSLLLGMMDDVLQEAGITVKQLDALTFGCGPGAFTGLRIAVAVAQAVGFAADLPLVPISNLALLAQGLHSATKAPNVIAALDARMGEIYICAYTFSTGTAQAATAEQLIAPEKYAFNLSGVWHGVGRGWATHGATLISHLGSQVITISADLLCHSKDLLPLAIAALEEGRSVPPEIVTPSYLRDQVAWKRPYFG